jgi:hypothetical protein
MSVVAPERERTPPPPYPPPPEPAPEQPRRRIPTRLVAIGLILAAFLFARDWLRDLNLLPSLPGNPFAAETVDHSPPAVLKSIQDLGEYRAATGHFEVIVDVEQETALPDSLLGERTLFVAVGNVDAAVDFTRLDGSAIAVSDDRRSATITLAAPRLSDVRLDLSRSYVYDHDSGVLNRIGRIFSGGGDDPRELYTLAERKLRIAAGDGSGLLARAEDNTRELLESMLRALGFTRVTVRFEPRT